MVISRSANIDHKLEKPVLSGKSIRINGRHKRHAYIGKCMQDILDRLPGT